MPRGTSRTTFGSWRISNPAQEAPGEHHTGYLLIFALWKVTDPGIPIFIAAIAFLQPALDANYELIKQHTFPWPPTV
jgi:hypothetical protein